MLSRDRKHTPHSKHMKLVEQSILLVGVHFVDGEKKRLAGARQQSRQLAIGACDLGAGIDDHDNCRRLFERDLGLTENFRRDEVFIFGNDAARIHHSELVSEPFNLAIKAVACDAGLVADDSAPRSCQMVEERRFADVRPSDDGNEWGWFLLAQRFFILKGFWADPVLSIS